MSRRRKADLEVELGLPSLVVDDADEHEIHLSRPAVLAAAWADRGRARASALGVVHDGTGTRAVREVDRPGAHRPRTPREGAVSSH